MPAVQQWGRRESIIWPPRRYLYTLGAIFLSLVATGFFVYVRFQFGLSPLERYYLPYYLRTEIDGSHASRQHLSTPLCFRWQVAPSDCARSRRRARDDTATDRQPLPLVLSSQARQQGFRLLFREQPRSYSNKSLHAWIAALGLCRYSPCSDLYDATHFWPRGLRAATSIFRPQGYQAHQETSLRAPSQRPRSCEC